MNNLLDMLKAIKNPREFVLNNVVGNSNPMLKNLIEMAQKGDTKGVENFARNFFKERGEDFDKIMSNFQ